MRRRAAPSDAPLQHILEGLTRSQHRPGDPRLKITQHLFNHFVDSIIQILLPFGLCPRPQNATQRHPRYTDRPTPAVVPRTSMFGGTPPCTQCHPRCPLQAVTDTPGQLSGGQFAETPTAGTELNPPLTQCGEHPRGFSATQPLRLGRLRIRSIFHLPSVVRGGADPPHTTESVDNSAQPRRLCGCGRR